MTNTETQHYEMVKCLTKPGSTILESLDASKVNAWHAATGVVGEAGELIDAVKKHIIYDQPIDINNVIEELGDLEFYMEQIRQEFGLTREECLDWNMKKLADKDKGRYAEGYSDAAAAARRDKQ
jgi:NTP pyrophosphatase (non-canonical NTP hydrolase)